MEGICSLASGSKGNCFYIGTPKTKILVDAGIGIHTLQKRLQEIHVNMADINAILISHEHIDHIRSVGVLSKKYSIPLFTNGETAKAIITLLPGSFRFKIFSTEEHFHFRDLKILPFSIQHDALDPVAFIIETGSIKIGICTDLGFVTSLTKKYLEKCNYLVLESNHEVNLVHASSRSTIYKRRVLSRMGHLSNDDCGKLLQNLLHKELRHVVLAHLSAECNRYDLALNKIKIYCSEIANPETLSIAYQDQIGKKLFF
ncbi:MAG: MBL fold metallo-hydrolase [Chlamydiales bacterium]